MPSQYWQLASGSDAFEKPPSPVQEDVVLEKSDIANDKLAVLWFGGVADQEETRRRTLELKEALEMDPEWKLKGATDTSAFVLQYNDPFQPPWKRRNEVALFVEKR